MAERVLLPVKEALCSHLLADDRVFIAGAVVRAVRKGAADEPRGLVLIELHVAHIKAVFRVVLVIQAVLAF